MLNVFTNYSWFRDDFCETCKQVGISNDPEPFLRDLLARWDEGRPYHNLTHLVSVLTRIDHLVTDEETNTSQHHVARLAAYYHDVVYVPGWKLNETLSWEYAATHMNYLFTPSNILTPLERAIMATRDHVITGYHDTSARLLVDADLFGLGTEQYKENGENVRAEFGNVIEPVWVRGRKKFLYSYLGRDQIYYTEGQDELEYRARQNMEAELANLIEGGV